MFQDIHPHRGRAHRTPPDRHEVQRPFFPALEKYLHLVSESHNITPYTKQEDSILRTFRQRWADAVDDLRGLPGLTSEVSTGERQHTLLCSLGSTARGQGTESTQRGMLAVREGGAPLLPLILVSGMQTPQAVLMPVGPVRSCSKSRHGKLPASPC